MNTTHDTQNTRPFGYWIKAVDRLMAAEFATAFESEGASRRDWHLLNVIDGTVPAARPLHPRKLHGLVERGWVAKNRDGWTLTDDGRAAKERLGAVVDGIRAQVADAVSPEDFDTTVATLEQIARTFGWDENTPLPRGRRGSRHGHFGERRGFGEHRRFGEHGHFGEHPRFGEHHRFGRAHVRAFGHEHGPHVAPEFGHGHPAQRAYERGFDAGYSRGRDA